MQVVYMNFRFNYDYCLYIFYQKIPSIHNILHIIAEIVLQKKNKHTKMQYKC